jgi:hypothetical protein
MKRVAKSLESLVEQIAQLEATAALAKGITDKDLEALVSRAANPIIKARTAHVGSHASIGFFQIALSNAISELKIIANLTDDEAEFPSLEEPAISEPESIVDPLQDSEVSELPLDLGEEDHSTTVDVRIDGEGVEVVNDSDGKCYIVLPDDSVMSLHKATTAEATIALEKLNRSTKE